MDLEIFDDTNSAPAEKIQLVKNVLEFSGKYLELPEVTDISVSSGSSKIGRAHV